MAKFRAIVNAVRQAITGNATTADVLSGKTFMSSASPNEQTGAMTNNGAVTASLTADGQVYTIPAGYHNGAGKVTATFPADKTSVWTVTGTPATYPATTLNIDMSAYDGIYVDVELASSLHNHQIFYIGKNQTMYVGSPAGGGRFRTIQLLANSIVISGDDSDNSHAIPYQIWGTNISFSS